MLNQKSCSQAGTLSLSGLNPEQCRAVEHPGGPLLVVAGAGSGKTRVLTYRIAYLIQVQGVPAWRILAVTFTNKAAQEMKERVASLVGARGHGLWIGTFHSICAQILRQQASRLGFTSHFAILDTTDQLGVIKQCLQNLGLDSKKFEPRAVLSQISRQKNELVGPDEYEEKQTHPYRKQVARIYKAYQADLQASNAMDFDDLLLHTVELFERYPEVLADYQHRFDHILVDEYQDTNHAQYVLVKMLAALHRNVCVVGDEDQSIYSFRGADIRNILDFEHDYPDATVIKLEQNYRSTQRILEAANQVIRHNRSRKEKTLRTSNPLGDRIKVYQAPDERYEAAFVASEIQRQVMDAGGTFRYRDFTILYRTHAQSRTFEEEFIHLGIPYRIVAGVRFYERKEIKDIVAYLRVLANPADDLSLLRIINVPKRGVGDTSVQNLQAWAAARQLPLYQALAAAQSESSSLPIKGKAAQGVAQLYQVLEQLRAVLAGLPHGPSPDSAVASSTIPPAAGTPSMVEGPNAGRVGAESLPENPAGAGSVHPTRLSDFVAQVLEQTGYKAEVAQDKSPEAESRWENVREFLNMVRQFELQEPEAGLDELLEHIALVSDVDAYDRQANAVTMMTFHSAKGLEFPVVFMVGMEDGIFPHTRLGSGDEMASPEEHQENQVKDLEEERRLCYVGITRAQKALYFTYAQRRFRYGATVESIPSCFLAEVDPDLLEPVYLAPGRGSAAVAGKRHSEPARRPGYLPPGYPLGQTARRSAPVWSMPSPKPGRVSPGSTLAVTPGGTAAPVSAGTHSTAGSSAGSEAAVDWKVGDLVVHDRFGQGQVVAIEPVPGDVFVSILFPGQPVRKFLLSVAPLHPAGSRT